MSLGEAIDTLSSLSALPITIDPDALAAAGVSLRDPVSVRLKATTVGKALEAILAARKLALVADAGRVLVTSPAEYRETLRLVHYTISDLTGGDAKGVAELAGLIQEFGGAESWQIHGGRGSLRDDRGALAIMQTGAVHDQIVAFCEKLRIGQGKPPRSRLAPERFNLATRWDRGRAMLDKEVSVNFSPPRRWRRSSSFSRSRPAWRSSSIARRCGPPAWPTI